MSIDRAERRRRNRAQAKVLVTVVLRTAATAAVLGALYYLTPVWAKTRPQEVAWLLGALAVFAAVVALQARLIVNARYPRLRAVEALAVVIPLFLLVFARIYLTVSTYTPAAFTAKLNHNGALYFTITVFSTVGFGDISPKTDFARLLVAAQMLLDLVVFGAVVKLLLGAVERNTANKTD